MVGSARDDAQIENGDGDADFGDQGQRIPFVPLDAIAWAINRGAHVINASWGGCNCRGANTCVLCRDANAMGAGLLHIADAVTSVLGTERHILRSSESSLRPALAAVAVVLLAVALWWCCFDHNSKLLVANDQPIRAIGLMRVDAHGSLFLDDGTAAVPVTWLDWDRTSSPGSLVYIQGRWSSQEQRLHGHNRVTLWPSSRISP